MTISRFLFRGRATRSFTPPFTLLTNFSHVFCSSSWLKRVLPFLLSVFLVLGVLSAPLSPLSWTRAVAGT